MSRPHQEIQDFLLSNGIDPKSRIEVSLQFARAMCKELGSALGEWEQALEALEQMKTDAGLTAAN